MILNSIAGSSKAIPKKKFLPLEYNEILKEINYNFTVNCRYYGRAN
jgi:hypothetical protein